MPTDHACQAAAELAGQSLAPVRAFLAAGYPSGAPDQESDAQSAGAGGLLVFLDGVHADLTGALAGWHAAVGDRLPAVLGVPVAGTQGPPIRQPAGWEALTLVQGRAQEVLTVLAGWSRNGPVRSGDLSWRLALVEDAFAGALRRIAVPQETSVRCAAEMAAAAGSLFGLRPPPPPVPHRPRPEPPSEPARPDRPSPPTTPIQFPDWTTGLP